MNNLHYSEEKLSHGILHVPSIPAEIGIETPLNFSMAAMKTFHDFPVLMPLQIQKLVSFVKRK